MFPSLSIVNNPVSDQSGELNENGTDYDVEILLTPSKGEIYSPDDINRHKRMAEQISGVH
jgi:hypothetical protein